MQPEDRVRRNFKVDGPNRLWVNDVTYVGMWGGFAYTAFVVDAFSRRIVGWKVSGSLETGLALDALEMAIWSRRGQDLDGLVHHSDRGPVSTPPSAIAPGWKKLASCPRSAREGTAYLPVNNYL